MCRMIAELVVDISFEISVNIWEMTNQRILFPEPAMQVGNRQEMSSERYLKTRRTYVFHGPTEGSLLTSIL
jgi:hypothetical protein